MVRGPDQPSRSHHVSGTTAKARRQRQEMRRAPRPAVIASTLSCDAVLNRLVLPVRRRIAVKLTLTLVGFVARHHGWRRAST